MPSDAGGMQAHRHSNPTTTPQQTRILWFAVGVLLISFALWSSHLAEPFIGHHENNTAYMTIAGANYLDFGYVEHGFAPIMHTDPSITTPTTYYWNHPPLGPLLASMHIALFGQYELSSRLVPIFLTMLGMSGFGLWLRRVWGGRIAIMGIALFAAFPMVAYFAQMLNHEPLILAFALLVLPLLDTYSHHQVKRTLLIIAVLNGLMVLSGWQALFFSGIFLGYALSIRSGRLAGIIILSTIGGALMWLLPLMLMFPGFVDSLYEQFLLRSGINEKPWSNFVDFMWQIVWARWRPRYTESAGLLTLIGVAVSLTGAYRKSSPRMWLGFLLFVPSCLQILVFQQQTYTHDYTLYYFAPSIALFSAIALDAMLHRITTGSSVHRWLSLLLMSVLLLAFAASSLRWTRRLYGMTDTFAVAVGTVVREQTEPGDVIYASDIGWAAATWYYSQRDFRSLALAPDSNYFALYCLPDDDGNPLNFDAGSMTCRLERQ